MKYFISTLAAAILVTAPGCSKPAEPEVPPVPGTPANAPAGKVAPYYRDPRELPRDTPGCAEVCEAFAKAKNAFGIHDFKTFARLTHPGCHAAALSRIVAVVTYKLRVYDPPTRTKRPDPSLEALLGHPVAPTDDTTDLLAELLKVASGRSVLPNSLSAHFEGEPRVYELSEDKALVCVCLPGKLPPVKPRLVEFAKLDGKWLMNLVIDLEGE